jgi:hypothetical protein
MPGSPPIMSGIQYRARRGPFFQKYVGSTAYQIFSEQTEDFLHLQLRMPLRI